MSHSLRDELKQSTQSLHQWVEASDCLMILHQDKIEEAEYLRLISRMAVYFQQLEPLIAAHRDSFVKHGLQDIDQRLQRSGWLKSDLDGLSSDFMHSKSIEFKTLDSFSAAIGALYVCEGSTMGGMMIRPLLQKRLGEEYPFRFYQGYGKANMPMWKQFVSWMETIQVDRKAAMLAASEVFINLRACLDDSSIGFNALDGLDD